MAFWDGEIKELGSLYDSFKGHLPDIVKELEQLIKTEDPNVVMLYSRRCLEVIVTDLCENELKRPRKTEPLKGIIDKLNAEEKVPSHIITSMISLNSMANYGAHPKDFDPEQVKPVLNNLAIIIKWYLKYKDFKIVSKVGSEEKEQKFIEQPAIKKEETGIKPKKGKFFNTFRIVLLIILTIFLALIFIPRLILNNNLKNIKPQRLQLDGARVLFTDPRDNELYTEITIGSQIWMGENLRAVKFNDGTPIPLVKDNTEWEKTEDPAYCWYDNNKSVYKRSAYGALYNWFAVNTGKLCPVGWHVPSESEWQTLTNYVGDSIQNDDGYLILENKIAGMKLKEAGYLNWNYNDTVVSTNEFGFTALPGGFRTIYGVFWGIREEGNWWSSTEERYGEKKDDARDIEMNFNSNETSGMHQYKQTGMAVRCIRDSIR